MTTIVLVAHGSRDPRSAATITRLAGRVAAARPSDEVRLAFLELSLPSVEQVLTDVGSDAVVVPLLLGSAYHATCDLPARVAKAAAARGTSWPIAATLGGASLDAALLDRIDARPAVDTWLLTATGSSVEDANDEVHEVAARLEGRTGRWVRAAFVTREPSVSAARAAVDAAGARTVGVLPYVLAPGRLLDRAVAAASTDVVAPPLADDAVTAAVVSSRIDAALAARGQQGFVPLNVQYAPVSALQPH